MQRAKSERCISFLSLFFFRWHLPCHSLKSIALFHSTVSTRWHWSPLKSNPSTRLCLVSLVPHLHSCPCHFHEFTFLNYTFQLAKKTESDWKWNFFLSCTSTVKTVFSNSVREARYTHINCKTTTFGNPHPPSLNPVVIAALFHFVYTESQHLLFLKSGRVYARDPFIPTLLQIVWERLKKKTKKRVLCVQNVHLEAFCLFSWHPPIVDVLLSGPGCSLNPSIQEHWAALSHTFSLK